MPFTDWVAWAGLVVALVAALLAALQWASANRSAESSDRSAGAAERSAMAAERSATAAEDSARSTKVLAQLGQRPWITLEPLQVTEIQSGDFTATTITVQGTLRNVGRTPALEVRAHCRFEPYTLPVNGPTVAVPDGPSATLGPGVSLGLNHISLVLRNQPDAQELQRGQRKLLLFGECAYRDVFGKTHRTQWCYEYDLGRQSFAAFKGELNIMT
jgi:hypothetical protein